MLTGLHFRALNLIKGGPNALNCLSRPKGVLGHFRAQMQIFTYKKAIYQCITISIGPLDLQRKEMKEKWKVFYKNN